MEKGLGCVGMEERRAKTDRRDFLKKATVAGAGSFAGAVAINELSPLVVPEKMVWEKNQSHWAKYLVPANPSLETDLEADVAIIGGGFTGLSTAYYLRKANPRRRVVLLEAERCGNGASGRNGAMMLTMTEDRFMEWSNTPELDKRLYDLTTENIRRLRELSASLGIDAEIEQSGALQVCNTKEMAEAGAEMIRKAQAAGLPFEYWDQEKISEAIGTKVYPGGLFDPGSGQVHPGKLVVLLKTAAESVGTELFEGTPVMEVEEGESIRLTTSNGRTVKARQVVLATNAYTSKLGYLRRATTPFFDYVGMTKPLSDIRLSQIGWRRRIPFNDSQMEVFYLGLTRDNRIHIGGGPVDYEFNNGLESPVGAESRYIRLKEELVRIFPGLSEEEFETKWCGAIDMSLDQTPSIGSLSKYGNLFYAIGFSGHGVNLTSVFGRILAELIDGKEKDWSWLPYVNRLPLYTPNEPFRWIGVKVALGYYRMMGPR